MLSQHMHDNTKLPITPELFWQVFSERLAVEWNDPAKQLNDAYNSGRSWTSFMTTFLSNLAEHFGLYAETEYRKVDVAYFDKGGEDWGEWAMEAAIEIENGVNWTEEIAKLLLFNAGLKVVIAYDDVPENISNVLNRFLEVRHSRKYLTENESWLFVFGPRLMPSNQDFVAFKFSDGAITNITGDTRVLASQSVGS